MYPKWNELNLSDEFLNSIEFKNTGASVLSNAWPLGGITSEWIATQYDIWHRHLIPLSDFMMSPEDAMAKFGLLHFSGEEDPHKIEIYYRNYEKLQNDTRCNLENKIKELESKSILNSIERCELQNLLIERNFMISIDTEEQIKRGYEDLAIRNAIIETVGERVHDPRRYVIIHRCFDNVRTIYLMMEHLFPETKWGLILSPRRHALITSGTPIQLKTYLFHDENATDFLIAEPIVPERDDLAALMGNPEEWRWFQKRTDILSFSNNLIPVISMPRT